MRPTHLAACALTVVGLGSGLWLLQKSSTQAQTSRAGTQHRTAKLEDATRRDESPLRPAETRALPVVKLPRAPASAASDPSAPVPEPVATSEPRIETTQELELLYANAFDAEPVDPAWAPSAQQTMGREIQAHLPKGSNVLGFECRSRFCRLDIVHDSIDTANEMLMDLFRIDRDGPFSRTSQGFRQVEPTPTPDNRHHFTVYIGRPGVSMALDPAT